MLTVSVAHHIYLLTIVAKCASNRYISFARCGCVDGHLDLTDSLTDRGVYYFAKRFNVYYRAGEKELGSVREA